MAKDAQDPGTIDIFKGTAVKRTSPEEKARQNRERVRRHRERQKAKGLKLAQFQVTEKERFFLERILEEMRETGGTPAAMRDAKGKFYHLDI